MSRGVAPSVVFDQGKQMPDPRKHVAARDVEGSSRIAKESRWNRRRFWVRRWPVFCGLRSGSPAGFEWPAAFGIVCRS